MQLLSLAGNLLLLQVLPPHSHREDEAASSHPCCQIEDAINALGVSDQYTCEIRSENDFSEASSSGIDDALAIDRRCILGDEIAEIVAEYGFRETEEDCCSKRLAESGECHSDG